VPAGLDAVAVVEQLSVPVNADGVSPLTQPL